MCTFALYGKLFGPKLVVKSLNVWVTRLFSVKMVCDQMLQKICLVSFWWTSSLNSDMIGTIGFNTRLTPTGRRPSHGVQENGVYKAGHHGNFWVVIYHCQKEEA